MLEVTSCLCRIVGLVAEEGDCHNRSAVVCRFVDAVGSAMADKHHMLLREQVILRCPLDGPHMAWQLQGS